MKFIFAAFLFIFIFGISVYSQNNDPVPAYAGGAANNNSGQSFEVKSFSSDEIKNKILIDLFFKGEVADGFIDANLYEEILGDSGKKTYSEAREALIIWINDNPDRAAKMYFDIYGRKSDQKTIKFKYRNMSGRLNPHFLQLIKNLNDSAKNFLLDNESLSMAGRRLFEGLIVKPDYANVDLPSFAPREEGGYARDAEEERKGRGDFADFKLNHNLLEKEIKTLSLWISTLKNNVEKKIYQEKFSAEYDSERIRALYAKTFKQYKTFIVQASLLKGRENITDKESSELEKERLLLRKSLIALQLLMEYGRLNSQTKIFSEKYQDFAFLGFDSEKTLREILQLLDKIEQDGIGSRELNLRAAAVYSLAKNSFLKNDFYLGLIAFKKSADDIRFSCVYDFLIFTYLKTLKPLPDYVGIRNQLQRDCDKIEKLLFKIKNGEEDEIFALMLQDKNSGNAEEIIDTLKRMAEALKRLAEFSAANKKIQWIFWDVVFNPFKIYTDKDGKMKVKINLFIEGAL
ncbi:MAG: hypothetical protein L6420_03820 [Elusimicrobia bacterium]|nr:hypothetical protein [Elusimicrobiota bacterium]